MNAIFQLLNPSNTVSVNRPLAHALGLNEAVVYGALISKFYYYSEREMLDDGWFYSTAPDLEESTALSEKQQKRCVDNLVKAGLIRCELRGMPAKRSFYIIDDISIIQALIAEGEAAMRKIKPAAAESYEKKRKSENTEPNESTKRMNDFLAAAFGTSLSEEENSNCEIPHNSAVSPCSDKRAEQAPTGEPSLLRQKVGASSDETANQHFIKTKDNKPKGKNLINQSICETDGIDRIDFTRQNVREKYEQIVRENISYDYFLENKNTDIREIDELVSLIVEVICSNKPTVRANGEEIPQEVVKSQFLKLNESHIEYVLAALKKNNTNVRNIRSYLITALYNAPATISSYYQAEVNYDMFNKYTTDNYFENASNSNANASTSAFYSSGVNLYSQSKNSNTAHSARCLM
ncbi:MAG: hypothetical protein J6C38_10245 [Oscillospiraceae bacterium]|nr:hypothetical protein [Oscillospiraceae bacterium]